MAVDPFSIGAGVFSLVTNLVGGVAKAGAQRRQAQLDAYANEQNAFLADEAATDATIRGAIESGYHRMQGSYEIAQARAEYGASGVDGSTGTPADSLAAHRMVNELEARTIMNNAAREARGYAIESFRFRETAKRNRERGNADFFTTLLMSGADAGEGAVRIGGAAYSPSSTPAPYGQVRPGYGSGRGITGGEK